MDDSGGRTNRRELLAVVGTAVATAGCGGSGDTADGTSGGTDGGDGDTTGTPPRTTAEGPAAFTASVAGPSAATVGEDATFTVSVRNVGGEPGAFGGSVAVREGAEDVEASVSTGELAPGETGETAATVAFSLADDYVLGVSGASESDTTTVAVGPQAVSLGEPVSLPNGLRVTLRGVDHETGLFYTGEDAERLYAPASEQVLGVCRLEIENTSSSGATIADLRPSTGSVVSSYPNGRLSETASVDGAPLGGGVTVQAGQRLRRWVAVQVSRTAATGGYGLVWQRDVDNTRPEARWEVDATDLPSFELAEWDLPSESAPGELSSAVTVTNDGNADGTFRGVVERRSPSASEWDSVARLDAPVPAGESRTLDLTDDWRYTVERQYRVRPLGERRRVSFTAPTLSVGEPAFVPFGEVTATAVASADSLVIDTRNDRTVTPNEERFLFVEIEYTNRVGTDASLPGPGVFSLRANGESFGRRDLVDGLGGSPGRFLEPIDGREIDYERMVYNGPYGTGESKRGWALFDVPAGVTAENARLTYQQEFGAATTGAEWTLE